MGGVSVSLDVEKLKNMYFMIFASTANLARSSCG